jgi:hypothetical protein
LARRRRLEGYGSAVSLRGAQKATVHQEEEQMTEHREMRASDADRAKVVQRLRQATQEGRLGADEFDERLGLALHARTYAELEALVADLPSELSPVLQRPNRVRALLRRRSALIATAGALAVAAAVALLPSLNATTAKTGRVLVGPPLSTVLHTGASTPRPLQRVIAQPLASAPGPTHRYRSPLSQG